MKVSDAIAAFLIQHEVKFCFELIGGMIAHLIDSFDASQKIEIVSMHHEQAAAFAAEGVARASGLSKIAVAMGTSGPGATNLVTGIGSCWFDSIPCLFITGQVNRDEQKGAKSIRQQGFQELDIVQATRHITKFAERITSEDEILPMLHRALSLAQSGRKGPVLLDIPNDVQRLQIGDSVVQNWMNKPLEKMHAQQPKTDEINDVVRMCMNAKRPLFCFGGGTVGCVAVLQEQLDALSIPYVATLMGQQWIEYSPNYLKMIGTYGNRSANWAVQNCDLLVVLGSRLDVRQTGANVDDFARKASIVQIDVEPEQLNNRVHANLSISAAIQDFVSAFPFDSDTFKNVDVNWIEQGREIRSQECDEYTDWIISPNQLFEVINSQLSGLAVNYVTDVGNNQMWAAQQLRLQRDQSLHHSGGMGAMGFALPTAIGITLEGSRKTVVLGGDGGMQLNLQELDTIRRLNLDMLIIVLNNNSLGMVKNFQDMYFDGRDRSTKAGYSAPNFAAVSVAYGIPAVRVDNLEQFAEVFDSAIGKKTPYLIEVMMDDATECRPRVAFGRNIDDQYPNR
jgi:acetolactate synthase I/II/III large subunit